MGHLRQHGFPVDVRDMPDPRALKRAQGVPAGLEACHPAVVDGYVVEGHVPADAITRLLRERPPVTGLVVPGMPPGAPGMEMPGHGAQPYDVLTFDRSGRTTVFVRR